MNKAFLILFFILVFLQKAKPQDSLSDYYICHYDVVNRDTIILSSIEVVYIFPTHKFRNQFEARRYRRLIRNIKVAYPYSKLAGKKFDKVVAKIETMETEREKRQYINQVEQEIKDEFENDLKDLTITQGRILIKLVDRETGNTSYDVVKDLKGSFSALFWQTLARLFGSSLKTEYDPLGKDKMIEEIVVMIENGQL